MTELMEIKDFIQAYVKAVSSILEVEVTVVDNELERVGGTGVYEYEIGKKISHLSFFQKVIDKKQSGIINNVKNEFQCNECEKKDTCRELANIAYPIIVEGEAIGVIGIIAFNSKERERLLANSKKLEEFIKYMCVLIENKILALKLSKQLKGQINAVIKDKRNYSDENALIWKSDKIDEVIKLVNKVAGTDSTVLLTGESGTGKELIAKLIHNMSHRNNELMISVNCSAIPENLVESELFGYEEGAFTGAKKGGSMGKFELANNSTLFLDEIGEMPLSIQTKLLRALQERQIERIGGKKVIPVNVRVICATNKNLKEMVRNGTFRSDLFYRLNVIPINIPPLRERKEDIPFLINHFISYYNQKFKKNIKGLTDEAMQLMSAYNWPGNVRELKNVIEYLENVVDGEEINKSHLPNTFLIMSDDTYSDKSLKIIMESYEKMVLERLIKQADTTVKKENLAKQLGISRATLYRKLENYDLNH